MSKTVIFQNTFAIEGTEKETRAIFTSQGRLDPGCTVELPEDEALTLKESGLGTIITAKRAASAAE